MPLFRFTNLFQALTQAARLARQSFFQPSKAFDFLGESERNKYIYIWSFVFMGFTIGILLSIPHHLIHKKLIKSILFVFTVAAPLVVAGLVAFKSEVESKNEFAFEGAFAMAGGVVFVYAGVFAVAIASENAGSFAAAAAVAGAVAVAVAVAAARASAYLYSFTFIGLTMVIFSTMGGKIEKVEIYETIIYPLTFLTGYLLVSSFEFQKDSSNFKADFKDMLFTDVDVPQFRFAKAQKLSLVWAPLFALLIGGLIFSQREQELHIKVFITGGFAILPFFILRIPDYLICLPLWRYQRRKLLDSQAKGKAIIATYSKSILYKHEMIYFQLPGLHKIMTSFARDKEIGLKEAVKQINYLYMFTFQQKQARKSIIALGKDNDTTHQYIHYLLEEKSLPLVRSLSQENRLAELYLMLFEEKYYKKNEKPDKKRFPWLQKLKLLKPTKEKKTIVVPESLTDRLHLVCTEMKKEKRYRFNDEMIHTLEAAHQFLKAASLKDFYEGCGLLEKVMNFSREINYFTLFQQVASHLEKIKNTLVRIEKIERFESKRSFLIEQKEAFNNLLKTTEENFYQPFQTVWLKVLQHCTGLLEKEMKLLQGSAVLAIQLKNKEIFASGEKQHLYFQIHNKGQELASEISISLQTVSAGITSGSETVKEIPVIEAGKKKEIALPITAHSPIKSTIKGTLTFSDRTQENKSTSFSFPITVLKKSTRFKEINNPYVVGQPLPGDAPLFFGREDAYQFIDKNIATSGGHHTIVCYGLRRTGKTSLLYRIETQGLTDKRLVPIFFDMQGIDDEKHFYYKLSEAITKKLSFPPVPDIESFSRFTQFLEKIEPELGQRILLLMIDEFEELQMRVEDKKISKSIFSHIRHMMQHEKKLVFLFSGTHKLEEMSADYWSIFFNTAIYYRVSHLNPGDARRLIKEPVKKQLTYDGLAVEQILKMTCGQPFLTQLICHTIIRDLNENKKRNDAVINDVDDAVEQVITGETDHFSQYIWKESSLLEKLVLSAAAEELTHKQLDRITLDEIYNSIRALTDRSEKKEVAKALGKLVSREILCEGENGYFFPVNLLRKWIAYRYPLRKVREEM